MVWAQRFPRLFELFEESNKNNTANWFLQQGVLRALREADAAAISLEDEMQQLDAEAWSALLRKAVPYVHVRDEWGYHAQLFDRLNEAKRYIYLKRLGYQDIEFVSEESSKPTPDLCAHLGPTVTLMEVKTVRESEWQKNYFEIPAAERKAVRGISEPPEGLKKKLLATVAHGRRQLSASEYLNASNRILYLVVRLDFHCHGDDALYAFVKSTQPSDIQVVLHIL